MVLNDLLSDKETTRYATLQNQAVIDFPLLAHGHGCKEFNGLSCFNLSSQSKSIYAYIQKTQDLLKKLKKRTQNGLRTSLDSGDLRDVLPPF